MGEWRKVRLGDCIKEINERTTENNQYQVLSVTKDGIFSQEEYFKKQIASENNIGYKILRRNNLVFSTMNLWMGSIDVLTNYDIGIVSPAYKIFEFNENLMLPEYGNYFMKSYYMLEMYKFCSEQGASIVRRNLDLKQLLGIEINVPSIKQQEKIAKVLKNVDSIIDKYERLLKNKEQFIKVQFVEMFKKYEMEEKTTLDELSEFVTVGIANSATHAYCNDGVIMFRNQNIKENYLDDSDLIYINEEFANKYYSKKLKENDILVTRTGYPGVACLVPKKYENAQTFTTLIVRLKEDNKINNSYICNFINSEYGKQYVRENQVGVAQQNFGAKALEKMPIIVPPVEEQNKFAEFVKLIDKQKFELEKIINNYKDLKKGLMQQLLNGKITVKI